MAQNGQKSVELEEAVSLAAQGVAELRAEIDQLKSELEKVIGENNFSSGRNQVLEAENKRLNEKCEYYMRWNTELTINCTNASNLARSLIVTIDDGMNKARLAVAKGNGQISDTDALKAVAATIESEIKPMPIPDAKEDNGNHQPYNVYPRGYAR